MCVCESASNCGKLQHPWRKETDGRKSFQILDRLQQTWMQAVIDGHKIGFCCSYCCVVLLKCLMCSVLAVPKFYVLSALVVLCLAAVATGVL